VCRSIKTLFNFEPPTTEAEAGAAALQFVRKVSGYRQPSQANQEVFQRAVDEITAATVALLDDLVTTAAPRDRDEEAAKARARWQSRAKEAN
jgi:hypothetical protein